MVDEQLGRDLLSFGTPVLVLGDPAQLPPISGGGFFTEATSAPKDADSNEPWVPFNNGEAAMFSAPTWARWSIDLPECNKGVAAEDIVTDEF